MISFYTSRLFKNKLSIACCLLLAVILSKVETSFAQVTHSESFDGTTFVPTGWTLSGANSGSLTRVTAGTLPTQATHSGAGEVQWDSYHLVTGSADLITPVIDWSNRGGNTPTVSFWFYRDTTAYNSSTYDGEGVTVWVNTSAALGGTQLGFVPRRGGQSPSGTYLQSGSTLITHVSGWFKYTFNIPASFNTTTNYIVFDFVSKYGDNCFMDDEQYIAYPPAPCTPTYSNACGFGININNFTFNTLSSLNTGCNGNANSYIHYTTPTTSVQQGATYNMSMQGGPSPIYLEGYGVWIDYNQDGLFIPGEFVYASPTATTSSYSTTVTIPLTAPTGVTTLRARGAYNTTLSSTDYCTTFSWGETEDYDITIVPPIISFTSGNDTSCQGIPLTITNTTNNGSAYYYNWQFGDGTSLNNDIHSTVLHHTYTYQGNYTITVNVYDINNVYMGTASRNIFIKPGGNGYFYMSKSSICPGDNIQFDAYGNPAPYNWKMSDGFTNATSDFTRTFNTQGTYTVSLIVATSCGNDTIRQTVNVTNTIRPDSSFSSSIYNSSAAYDSACPNKLIYFYPNEYDGTHHWDFGDASTSTLQQPSHQYTTTGTYTVTHTITNAFCNNTTTQKRVIKIVNTIYPATANFSYNPSSPLCPGIQINFYSGNGDGKWNWTFGDGATSTSENPLHTYTSAATYSVTQTITNTCNNSLAYTNTVAITTTIQPTTTFNFNPNPSCPGDLISFYPTETDGQTYLWNFNDGNTSSLEYPSHQYAATGDYTVSLTLKNYCGNSATGTNVENVTGTVPVQVYGSIGAYPNPACSTQPINLYIGTGNGVKYIWDYGDGNTDTYTNANGGNTTHSYSVAGTYTVNVTIFDNCYLNTVVSQTVTIKSSIPFTGASLSSYPSTNICPGQLISFNGPWGYPTYKWTMGDGNPAFTTTNSYFNYSYNSAGTYIVSVDVTNYCGNDTILHDTVKVTTSPYFPQGSLYLSSGSPVCPNQSLNFYTTSGYASYNWLFGDGGTLVTSNSNATHTYTAAATYNYSVTITDFCGNDTTLLGQAVIDGTLLPPSWLSLYINPNIVCPGQEVQFQSDQGYNSYLWNFGDGSSAYGTSIVSHTYTANGTYNVSITVTNSCGHSNSTQNVVTISPTATFPPGMSMWPSPSSVCPNEPVTLQTYGGYSSYLWTFGDGNTTSTVGPLVSHTYSTIGSYPASVVVTNSCGNSVTLYVNPTITVQNNNAISGLYINLPYNPSCPGDAVIFNVSTGAGSTSNYIYSWNFGDGSPLDTTIGTGTSHTYTATGVYNVILTATNSCGKSATTSQLVTINNSSSPSINPWQFGVLSGLNQQATSVCPGDALVFYFDGIDPNNLWNFGDGSTGVATDIFVQSDGTSITTIKHAYANTGTYTYSLKLTNGCNKSSTLSSTINVSGNMLVSGGFIVSPPNSTLGYTTCGLINFVAYGGHKYKWDFGDGDTLTTISPTIGHAYNQSGNFTVKVTITNGCGNSATYSQSLIINGVGGASVNATSIVSPTCNGGNNGSAIAAVTGGQAPYTYTWKDALGNIISTNISAIGLSAGAYVVSVTDNNGCSGSSSFNINNPAAISLTTSSTKSSCGGSTGTATVNSISGGTSPYTYAWSNGQTTSAASNLSLGNYGVTVTDAHGCTGSSNVSVSENGASVSISSTTSVTCNGGSNGSIQVSATGGTTPYTFAWSNSATTQNISGITAGNYSVVLTDHSGCHATINATISAASAINVNATAVVSPTCGSFNGSVIANVTGGTSPYAYLWDANAAHQTTQTATGLPKGSYTVTITDAHSCTNTGVVVLSNANAPIVTSTVTPISCHGANNGAINLTVTGGTSPYAYTWNTSDITENISGEGPGPYFVQINDAAGCITFKSFTLTDPAVLTASLSATAATCTSNGTVTASPSGGTAPYTYLWNTTATTAALTGLAAGGYSVTIHDSHACVTTASVSVGSNPLVSSLTPTDVTCNGFTNGSINLTVSGATSPYTFLWSNTAVTQNISNLTSAVYTVTITDSQGCTQTKSAFVNQPAVLTATITPTEVSCHGACNGTATANPSGGNSPYLYSWSTSSTQTTQTATGLCPAIYNLTITDNKGCNITPNVSITEPQALTVSVSPTFATCGNNDGTATATPTGGTTPYTYLWTGGSTVQSPNNLALGNYTVTVKDKNGCAATATTTITATTDSTPICMVTVDTATSAKNIIVWEKPAVTNIDSFRIYREIASVYVKIGEQPFSTLSTFTDNTNGVNPNITSYKYEIEAVDHCGGVSVLSAFHQTIHLAVSPRVPTGFNLSWNDYVGFPITQYLIFRDSAHTGWRKIDSVSYGNTSYSDIVNYPLNDSIFYMVEIDNPTGCLATLAKDPQLMATNYNSSKSNVYRNSQTATSVNNVYDDFFVELSPNPNNGNFFIAIKNVKVLKMQIFDMLGREIMNSMSKEVSKGRYNITMPSAQGVYTLKIISDTGIINKKFIIE